MGSVGFEEIIVILIVAIVIFGGKLPQVARQVAQQYARLKNYLNQMREEVIRQLPTEADLLPPEDVSHLSRADVTAPTVPDATQDSPADASQQPNSPDPNSEPETGKSSTGTPPQTP